YRRDETRSGTRPRRHRRRRAKPGIHRAQRVRHPSRRRDREGRHSRGDRRRRCAALPHAHRGRRQPPGARVMPHRVLIIEDDAATARYEQTILERAGFETKIVDSGAAGLEMAATFKPQIVLLDVGLPDISGLDVCTTLANQSDAYILMVSAHSSEDDKLAGLGLGADDYITKPFSGNELVARVQAFIRRHERTKQRT